MKVVIYILLVFMLLQSVHCQYTITTIAGTGSFSGDGGSITTTTYTHYTTDTTGTSYYGDGGDATSATLYYPFGVAVDSVSGNVYIADSGNSRIRKVTKSTGIISTFADTTTLEHLSAPRDVAVDATGSLFLSFFVC